MMKIMMMMIQKTKKEGIIQDLYIKQGEPVHETHHRVLLLPPYLHSRGMGNPLTMLILLLLIIKIIIHCFGKDTGDILRNVYVTF